MGRSAGTGLVRWFGVPVSRSVVGHVGARAAKGVELAVPRATSITADILMSYAAHECAGAPEPGGSTAEAGSSADRSIAASGEIIRNTRVTLTDWTGLGTGGPGQDTTQTEHSVRGITPCAYRGVCGV